MKNDSASGTDENPGSDLPPVNLVRGLYLNSSPSRRQAPNQSRWEYHGTKGGPYLNYDMKRLPLTGRRGEITGYALVDDADFEYLRQWRWHAHQPKKRLTKYAMRYAGRYRKNGKWSSYSAIRLHRVLTNAPKGKLVDHINGDGLDNRKENLRVCTSVENGANRHILNKNNKSGVPNVHWYADRRRWKAQVNYMGHLVFNHTYKTKEEAEEAVKNFKKIWFEL